MSLSASTIASLSTSNWFRVLMSWRKTLHQILRGEPVLGLLRIKRPGGPGRALTAEWPVRGSVGPGTKPEPIGTPVTPLQGNELFAWEKQGLLSPLAESAAETEVFKTISRPFFSFSPISTPSSDIHHVGQHHFQKFPENQRWFCFLCCCLRTRMKFYCFEIHNIELIKSSSHTRTSQGCTLVHRSWS